MVVRIVLRVIWTGIVAAAVGYLFVQDVDAPLMALMIVCVAATWGVVLWKLDDVVSAWHAVLWLWMISFVTGMAVAAATGETVSDWWMLAVAASVLMIWFVVLKLKLSPKWPLVALALLMLPCTTLWLGVVTAIGVGRLLIVCVGRVNVLARSRLAVRGVRVSPRGLVG